MGQGLDDDFFQSRPSLQMYLVLTDVVQAMQASEDVQDMWTAVRGERSDFEFVRRALGEAYIPSDYRIDIELDFPARLDAIQVRTIVVSCTRARKFNRFAECHTFHSRSLCLELDLHTYMQA